MQRFKQAAIPSGVALLQDPVMNKGTAFTDAERARFGLHGLLPARVSSMEEQIERVLGNIRRKTSDLEKYIYLIALQDRNETLFYRVLLDNLEELMPIVYTPTVGQGCLEYGHIFRRPRGLYISSHDHGRVDRLLSAWPARDIQVVVVTDGARILGLGDLGANGMGIPVGKLTLYTVCGGVHPQRCLPVTLDVGTDNPALVADSLYLGLRQPRLRGEPYDRLVEEFMLAVQRQFPHVLVQFEDFATSNAFGLLQRYRDRLCTFDDDIQGTAAVALAGIIAAQRGGAGQLSQQRLLFLGAGEAGIGIADLVVRALVGQGLPEEQARQRCWLLDSKGLVVSSRTDLAAHKRPYAHDHPYLPDLLTAVEQLRPSVLIGVSGQPGTFSQPVIEAMARINARPIILALSNPTSKSECSAEQAYGWSQGRAIFASGSPFAPVLFGGRLYRSGQGNNVYIFPGVGLGLALSGARRAIDEMFLAAAQTLAGFVLDEDLQQGRIYPPLPKIRAVSAAIAAAVAGIAYDLGLATRERPADLPGFIEQSMYQPVYRDYLDD